MRTQQVRTKRLTCLVAKGRIGEISNPTDRAWSYSMYIIMHQVAQIIGPPLGGMLYKDAPVDGFKTSKFKYPFIIVCGLGMNSAPNEFQEP